MRTYARRLEIPAPPPPTPPVDDFAQAVSATQEQLAAAASSAPMRRDPYGLILAGLGSFAGLFQRAVRRLEQAGPLSEDERTRLTRDVVSAAKEGAVAGARSAADRLVRSIDRSTTIRYGSLIGSAFVVGAASMLGVEWLADAGRFSSASAWSAIERANPDPRLLLPAQVSTDPAGRSYYSCVSLWASPPIPPKR